MPSASALLPQHHPPRDRAWVCVCERERVGPGEDARRQPRRGRAPPASAQGPTWMCAVDRVRPPVRGLASVPRAPPAFAPLLSPLPVAHRRAQPCLLAARRRPPRPSRRRCLQPTPRTALPPCPACCRPSGPSSHRRSPPPRAGYQPHAIREREKEIREGGREIRQREGAHVGKRGEEIHDSCFGAMRALHFIWADR